MKNIALIPLRGGSKSIPKKNIKNMAGSPLCSWVLKSAIKSRLINEVYVSTDSQEIIDVVNSLKLGVKIIKRPDEYATDQASTESVLLHFMENVSFGNLITIQATSPLLEASHLDEGIELFLSKNFDSLLSVVTLKRFLWAEDGTAINYDPENRPRRQDFKGTYMENGAFYITRREILETKHNRLGGKIGIYCMPEETAVEIDEPDDWEIVERILKKRIRK